MGASQSHCEANPEAAGGQQDIQSSDTATKSEATTNMPKDAGKSNSNDSKEKSAPKGVGKDSGDDSKQSNGDSKTEANSESDLNNADHSDTSGSTNKDDSKSNDKPDSKADSKDNEESDSEEKAGDDSPDASKADSEADGSDGKNNSEADGEEEEEEEEPNIKREDVSTAPYDHRFPSFNQARHCFTRYNEFYKCKSEKGDEAPECRYHQKAYRSICPSEWLDRWNEQRESGTWPGRY